MYKKKYISLSLNFESSRAKNVNYFGKILMNSPFKYAKREQFT